MQRIKISDEIYFNMLSQEKFKTNFFQVSFVMDLERENTTNLSLLAGMLFRASEKYPDVAAINNRLDYLYDTNASCFTYKRGERIIFCYESDFLKNSYVPEESENLFEEAVEMFRQLIFKPRIVNGGFDDQLLALEKAQLEKEIKSIINNKNAYAKQQCIKDMCKDEKYSIDADGELEDIPNIDGKSLYEFYLKMLSTARIEVFFYGEGTGLLICKAFKDIFDYIQDRKPEPLCETFITNRVKDEVYERCEQMPVSQGKLAIGFRTGIGVKDKDNAALMLFNEIFGGSPVSKLFMNVREKLSLCYYCKSVPDSFKGVLFVLSGIESENRNKALDAILDELNDIKQGIISEEEIQAAKLSLINSYKTLDDNPAAFCSWFLGRMLCDSYLYPEYVAESIKNTTLEQIVSVAKKVRLDTVYFLKGTQENAGTEE